MKKLGLLLIACFAFAAFASAQNNIVKSLERNVPGQGKVTIHQDARIEALIGQEYIPNGTENRVLKSQGFRVQVYAGNNTSRAKNEAHAVGSRIKEYFPESYTSQEIEKVLYQLLDEWKKKQNFAENIGDTTHTQKTEE